MSPSVSLSVRLCVQHDVRRFITNALVDGLKGIKVNKVVRELGLMLLNIDRGNRTEQTISDILRLHGRYIENEKTKQDYYVSKGSSGLA